MSFFKFTLFTLFTLREATVDIDARSRGVRLNTQVSENPLQQALLRQIGLIHNSNEPQQLLMAYNPLRPFRMWNNNRIMKNALLPHIQRGIREYISGEAAGPKTINSLAIKAYLEEADLEKADPGHIDQAFTDMLISQLKIFLFAGHDTTSIALSYAYHLLHTHPAALARVRAELDDVFGPNPSATRGRLAENPNLLNQLPFLAAVIKESVRLFPPAAGIREGQPGFFLTHPETKKRYPTDGFMILSAANVEQRQEEFWPRANDFLPERWLAREGEPLHVRKNAFRSFELGPRNCIGQELAQFEMRAILALTVRDMDIESQYPDGSVKVLGDVAYQVVEPGLITAHARDGMPVRVRMRDQKR